MDRSSELEPGTPGAGASDQIVRSLQAGEGRWQLMAAEFDMLDGRQVDELLGIGVGSTGRACHLAAQGKILRARYGNRSLYPSFEFDLEVGTVRPVISEVAKIAGDRWGAESLLQWFCAPNGFLDGCRPVDVIDDEPALLVAARRSLAREW